VSSLKLFLICLAAVVTGLVLVIPFLRATF